jgi:hypothetical protein
LTIFETGAGKTVLNPKFALHSFNYNAKIAITLPKELFLSQLLNLQQQL